MSTVIDEKVVEMRFDNRQFEQNISTTMTSIGKLKQSLNLTGATKGLESIDYAAKKVDMSTLSNAAEVVGLKFNAMYTIADQALRNITNSAMNAGKRIASALTIDPVKTGFSEYETQINAVQTILANTKSKGTTLDNVNSALDELNTYADKTIYNFTEMTRNIGTFTAAGVDLDTSVSSIKGIANLAAVSGSTSQQASTAMYQLSQALAAGKVSLMDWNSVVNAGMGGELFQNALKRTAENMGTNVDALIKKYGSFRESLTQGNWLTTDVLTETLTQLSGAYTEADLLAKGYTKEQTKEILELADTAVQAATKVKTFTQLWDTLKEAAQSGWTQTWEIIVGDFEEAKSLLTNISDVIGGMINQSSKVRNDLLQGWKDAGGRQDLIDSFANIFNALISIVKPIKEAFNDIFPPLTVKQLLGFTEGLKNLTAKLTLSDKASNNLKRTFKGLFAVVDIAWTIISSAFKAIGSLFGVVTGLGGGILEVTGTLGDFLVAIRDTIKNSGMFSFAFQGIAVVLKTVFDIVSKFGSYLFNNVIKPLFAVGGAASDMNVNVTSAFESIKAALDSSGAFGLMGTVGKGLGTVFKSLVEAFGILTKGLATALSKLKINDLFTFLTAVFTGSIAKSIKTFTDSISNTVEDCTGIVKNVSGILDEVRETFKAYQSQLKANTLMKIAGAIGILVVSILVLTTIDANKLNSSLSAITTLFVDLMMAMTLMNLIAKDLRGVVKASTMMITMSIAVLILASALKTIGNLNITQVFSSLIGLTGIMGLLVATATIMGKMKKTVIHGAAQMVLFAVAIKILASACVNLASLSWSGIAKGLVGVGVLLAAVAIFMNNSKFSIKTPATAFGIVLLASAIKVLASACSDFGAMSWTEIGKGLTAIGVLLAEITAFTRLTGDAKHVISTGVALIAISTAMTMLAQALSAMGDMSWNEIARGLSAMAGSLLAITVALNFMPKNVVGSAIGLIGVATAILILSNAIDKMRSDSWSGVARGLVTLGGAMAILAIGLHAMKGTLGGSAALIVASLAIAMLTPPLVTLSALGWKGIAVGLAAIAASFIILGVAGKLLGPVVPTILGLAGAMALIGLAMLTAGAGIAAIGTGVLSIAAAIIALSKAAETSTGKIKKVVKNLVAGYIEGVFEGLTSIVKSIETLYTAIVEALKVIIKGLCQAIIECAPEIMGTMLRLGVMLLDLLVDYAPHLVNSLGNFILGVLRELSKFIPDFVQVAAELIMSIFVGVVKALGSMDTGVLVKGLAAVGLFAGVIAARSAIVPLIPMAMAGVVGIGVVLGELALVLAALGTLASIPGLDWLMYEGINLLETLGTGIGTFVGSIIGGLGEAITSSLPTMAQNLSDFMTNLQPFVKGAKQIDESVFRAVQIITDTIIELAGANIVDAMASWLVGESSMTKFGDGLITLGAGIRGFSDEVADINMTAVIASVKAFKALAMISNIIPNTGGMTTWFAGDNSVAKFGEDLIKLGAGLAGFSLAITGVKPDKIKGAAAATKSLVDMSKHVPKTGGMAAWFAGDNSVAKFGRDLVQLGIGLAGFSLAITGIKPDNIKAAASAAKSLAEMTSYIPNSGGLAAWFIGESSICMFGRNIIQLGIGLAGFSSAITGIKPDNIKAAAGAAKSLAEMTNHIPNTGGIKAWFTGDNSILTFANHLPFLGNSLSLFSTSVANIEPDNIKAAASAAKSLAEMTSHIPNTGGMIAWFTGDNSIAKFGNQLPNLGRGLKRFSDSVTDIKSEAIKTAVASAKSIVEMTKHIPDTGGVVAWFTGDNSIAKFAHQLPTLGRGLKRFSDSVDGINAENIKAAANTAKILAQMTATIPNSGGIAAWFTGESSIANFVHQLPTLGKGLKGFSDSIQGIVAENITAAANAAKALAEMTNHIPNSGGVVTWFTGENSVSKFASQLPALGKGLKGFSDSVKGIVAENITAAASAAKSIAEMANVIPNEGGMIAWFTGDNSMAKFAGEMPALGKGIKGFSDAVKGISVENVKAAASAAKSLAETTNTIPKKTDKLVDFGNNLKSFGDKLSSYFSKMSSVSKESISGSKSAISAVKEVTKVDGSKLKSIATAIDSTAKAVKNLSSVPKNAVSDFSEALEDLGKASTKDLLKPFKDIKDDMKKVGKEVISAFIKGAEDKKTDAKKAAKSLAKACADTMEDQSKSFKSAGKACATGFANGISANTFKAEAKAKAMAEAAVNAAKKKLKINSPSKVFIEIGKGIPEGFAMGVDKFGGLVNSSVRSMADTAISNVSRSLSAISNTINSNIDAQPTIRPVLDLSDVRSGASAIGSMLAFDSSVGVTANVGAINSMMNSRIQNGEENTIVAAINKLRKDLGNVGNTTYHVDGVTYDDGSAVSEAIKTIIRAAKIERRA